MPKELRILREASFVAFKRAIGLAFTSDLARSGLGNVVKKTLGKSLASYYATNSYEEPTIPEAWNKYLNDLVEEVPVTISLSYLGPKLRAAKSERDTIRYKDQLDAAIIRVEKSLLGRWRPKETKNPEIALACYYLAHIWGKPAFSSAAKEIDRILLGSSFKVLFDMDVPFDNEAAESLTYFLTTRSELDDTDKPRVDHARPAKFSVNSKERDNDHSADELKQALNVILKSAETSANVKREAGESTSISVSKDGNIELRIFAEYILAIPLEPNWVRGVGVTTKEFVRKETSDNVAPPASLSYQRFFEVVESQVDRKIIPETVDLRRYSKNFVADLVRGKGSKDKAVAIWYWFHIYCEDKRFAEEIDLRVLGKPLNHDLKLR